jgi:putative spermidine/putrescine transport system substrate-binding protein
MKIRNQLKAIILASATGLTLAGCSLVSGGPAEDTLVFGGFGGDFKKAAEESLIKPFEEQFDVKVQYVEGSSGELYSKARSAKNDQTMDVIWTSPLTHIQGKDENLFGELDKNIVTNINDLYPLAIDDDNIGVAHDIQALGIEYNTRVFKEKGWDAPTSWEDLLDEKYEGHVVGQNMPISYASVYLVKAAELNGGDIEDLDAGFDTVEKLKNNALSFVDSPADVQKLFTSGAAWIAYDGSGRAALSKESGLDVDFVYPEDGAPVITNYMDVLKDAPNPELAQEFVNMSLDAQVQAEMSETELAGPVNSKADLTDEVADKVPYGPEEVNDLDDYDLDKLSKDLDEYTSRWVKIVGN